MTGQGNHKGTFENMRRSNIVINRGRPFDSAYTAAAGTIFSIDSGKLPAQSSPRVRRSRVLSENRVRIWTTMEFRNSTGWIHGRHTTGAFPFPNRLADLSGSLSVGLELVGAEDLLVDSTSDSLSAGVESRDASRGSCPISCSGLLFKSDDKEAGVGGGPISVWKPSRVNIGASRSIKGVLTAEESGVSTVNSEFSCRIGTGIGRLTVRRVKRDVCATQGCVCSIDAIPCASRNS